MAWGVLEDHNMATVPGTAILRHYQESIDKSTLEGAANLKKSGKIVLVPQPSDSPNDPLNWPSWQKNAIVIVLALATGVTIGMVVMLTPAFDILSDKYHMSFFTVSSFLLGTLVLATGVANFFTSAAAIIWGKRPVFIISTLVLLACCIWGFLATSFASLAAMRVVEGMTSAPLETATIGDIFFVHQRGRRLGIWAFMILGGIQIAAGYIIDAMGVEWTFAFCGFMFGLVLLAMYFFVPETAFDRQRQKDVEMTRNSRKSQTEKDKADVIMIFELSNGVEQRLPYRTRLRIFGGRVSKQSFWKVLIKPFTIVGYPAVVFSTVVHGSFHTWLVVVGLVQANVLTAAPYDLCPSQLGLTTLPTFGVGILTGLFAGWFTDWLARFMAGHAKGVYEPEFRLLLMVPAVMWSTLGFVGFGFSVEEHAPLWQVLFFSALFHMAVPFAMVASHTYVVDCHQKDASAAFVIVNFTKSILTFVASWHIDRWLDGTGPRDMFIEIAIVNLAVSMLTVPVYIYGKRFRSQIARSRA